MSYLCHDLSACTGLVCYIRETDYSRELNFRIPSVKSKINIFVLLVNFHSDNTNSYDSANSSQLSTKLTSKIINESEPMSELNK